MTDDCASYSGTSMASPYVAGASVLVREAMQFVGNTNITQDTIYNHMMATADAFFDAATNQTYKRLNVARRARRADAGRRLRLDGGDGAQPGHARSTGTEVTGLIGKLSDADYFRFTAAATGTVTFTADTTHALNAVWTGTGAVSGPDGNTYTFDVVAGQSYTVGLSTSDGIGYFDLTVTAESAFTFTDWGTITQSQTNDVATSGEIVVSRPGQPGRAISRPRRSLPAPAATSSWRGSTRISIRVATGVGDRRPADRPAGRLPASSSICA